MEKQPTNPQHEDEFEIPLRTHGEMLAFALQLASPCLHCSLKANIALAAARLMCMEGAFHTKDQRYMEAQYILSGAILAAEGLDEEEAEEARRETEAGATPSHHVH